MRLPCRSGRFAYRVPSLMAALAAVVNAAAAAPPAAPFFKQYCVGCHGAKSPAAGVNLEEMLVRPAMDRHFDQWDKVVRVLRQKRMPPPNLPQPPEAGREQAIAAIRAAMTAYANANEGDPGRVTLRRLTSSEYVSTVRDLTGLTSFNVDGDFVPDSVGGEGFTNFGDVQFMQDADVERYLRYARRIADHAVIGAGPLYFFADPGRSGFELSAIDRINAIYRTHGFRAASGEGGKPYGLDRYAKAFYVSWRYLHREKLGEPRATLADLGAKEGLSARFAEHIWNVLRQTSPTYPTSETVERWRNLPAPDGSNDSRVRQQCHEIQKALFEWPRWLFGAGALAEGGEGDERALVLTGESLAAATRHRFRFFARSDGKTPARIHLSAISVNPRSRDRAVIHWRNATVRFRKKDRSAGPQIPLAAALDPDSLRKLGIERREDGQYGASTAFVTPGGSAPLFFQVVPAPDASAVEVQMEAEIGPPETGDAVVRCTISESEDLTRGRPVSALLGHSGTAGFEQWKAGVLELAAALPQTSHGEATPSDKDPIPAPFDNTYNQPERDRYHTKLKYYRTDRFLVEKMLDDATRARLDQAWSDLLTSFEYHDAFWSFVAEKFRIGLRKPVAEFTAADIASLPEEPRRYARELKADLDALTAMQKAAQPRHIEDCLRFAELAWRRPLSDKEKDSLRGFYNRSREGAKLDHAKAIRALIARILVSPAFLYRLEQPVETGGGRLSGVDLASRLSYFLWSSLPDEELRRAAARGDLHTDAGIAAQVRRMLADPKARRFATEFFGQWLGFYRFDEYRGVDAARFPEFTPEVRSAMYEEAVAFFEHIVRKDRPVREIFFAGYSFLNEPLAKFYGLDVKFAAPGRFEKVEDAGRLHRGGLLRLGAILTSTSAPLRTSPVKRGDWLLRRVLGTPTPPPPADAGSIPADERSFGGLSLREKLKAHMRNPACASCHSRIDPLGFPLERYDAVGRWRDRYHDGKPVEDTGAMAGGEIAGVDGLLAFLQANEEQVLRTLSRKLVGYALGRTVQPSDSALMDRMVKAGANVSFSRLVTEIALSRQFRHRRDEISGTRPPRPPAAASVRPRTSAPGGTNE